MKHLFRLNTSLLAPLLAMFVLLGAKSANATTFTVTTPVDSNDGTAGCTTSGVCSLRDAITAANDAGSDGSTNTINFAPTVFINSKFIKVRDEAPLPPIASNLYINGPTATGKGVILLGQDAGPVGPGPTLQASRSSVGLVVIKGSVNISSLSFGGFGAALVTLDGHTRIQNSAFAGNFFGIAIANGKPDTLTARNCTFFGNLAALDSENSPNEDGTYRPGTLLNCTVAGNYAGVVNGDRINISNSIVAGNGIFDVGDEDNVVDQGNNLIEGDPFGLGLDSRGLGYNGGPTPTLALLGYSPAINAGNSPLSTDQRGFARDSKPDIGAFEFVNVAPRVNKVTPQGATDKVGDKRTFSLTVSDTNLSSDLHEVWFLINDQADVDSGAALLYQPYSGLLFLRKDGQFLPPIHIGSEATATDVLDNDAIHIVGSEVTTHFEDDSLTLTIPATVKSGLIGKNTLFVRVVDTAGTVDPTAKPVDLNFVRCGRYTVNTLLPNSAPTLSKLAPRVTLTTLNAQGIAPNTQNFGFYIQDKDGAGDIREVWLTAGRQPGGPNSATFVFYPRNKKLLLRSDDGQSWLGGGAIGSSGIIENSQVKVDLSQVREIANGDGQTIQLILPLQAKSGLLGTNNVWLRVQDSSGTTSSGSEAQGFVLAGSWIVLAPSAPANARAGSQPSAGTS